MAFDESVAERGRKLITIRPDVTERKMFGGLAFMVSGNRCVGIVADQLMLRVGPEQYESCLKKPHVRKMDFTGHPMKGMIYLAPASFVKHEDLVHWIDVALCFVQSLPAK